MKRVALMVYVLIFGPSAIAQEKNTLIIRNPTRVPVNVFFKSEADTRYRTPPLGLSPGQSQVVKFTTPGKYKTVVRVLPRGQRPVDSTLGWWNYQLTISHDPNGVFEVVPYVVMETREQTYTVRRYVFESRVDEFGRPYTVRVPVVEERTRTVNVQGYEVRTHFVLSNGQKIEGWQFMSDDP